MKAEVQKLLQKAKRSLAASQRLLADGDYDFTASRAYYAMFYAAEAVLLSKGLSFSKHSGVITAFGRHFVKQGVFPERLHEALREAFAKRNLGDYGYETVFPKEEAGATLRDAEGFVQAIESYFLAGSRDENA